MPTATITEQPAYVTVTYRRDTGDIDSMTEYLHDLVWDPPAMSSAERWTCTRRKCRRSVVRYHGNVYGTATTEPCDATDAELFDSLIPQRIVVSAEKFDALERILDDLDEDPECSDPDAIAERDAR